MIIKEAIVLLDFKGNVNSTKLDSRSRHNIYGKRLRELTLDKPLKFVVISRGSESGSDVSDSIDFYEIKCSKIQIFKFIFSGIRVIRKSGYLIKVIVCGDPWESFLLGKIFQIFLRNESKLQVQVHADISDINWRNSSFRNWIRSKLHRYAFNNCNQVRVVSNTLKRYIYSISSNKNVLVIPVPIVVPSRLKKVYSESSELLKIGFFGRLQKDRGTDDLIRLAVKLNSRRQDFALYVAGTGSEESSLRKNLKKAIGDKRSVFLGQLKHSEVWKHLAQLDVYLSLAPSESYGLGIREAIISGVPVLAIQSNGALEAQSQFGAETVKFIDSDMSADSLSMALDEILSKKFVRISPQEIREQNLSLIDDLVGAWIQLARSGVSSAR